MSPDFPATRGDLVLLRHAINAGWPVPIHRRRSLIENTSRHVETGNTRSVLAAARVLLAADRANVRDEQELLAQVRAAAKQPVCSGDETSPTETTPSAPTAAYQQEPSDTAP